MADAKPSRILVFGGTGYIGKYMVEASVSMGHPTYAYARPAVAGRTSEANLKLREWFRSLGVNIIEGTLEDHEKLVLTMKEVDVVISALAFPQVLDQFKIIDAIIAAGNIKRFLPSDFGCEEDRVRPLPPFEAFLEKKRKIRRAIEAAGIPFTYVSVNCFGAYFVNLLLHPHNCQLDEVFIYGSGEAKAVFNYEEDIAKYTIRVADDPRTHYTIRVADDPRTHHRLVIYRPKENIVSQLELVSLWEKKTGRRFKIVFVPEVELVQRSRTLPDPDNLPVSIIHSLFVRGDLMGFKLGEDDIEASELYPDMKFATVNQLLDVFLGPGAPKPAMASFK